MINFHLKTYDTGLGSLYSPMILYTWIYPVNWWFPLDFQFTATAEIMILCPKNPFFLFQGTFN